MTTELLRERYEPLDVVGRGGEGEVVRALDHLHGRQVALKMRPVGDAARAPGCSRRRVSFSRSSLIPGSRSSARTSSSTTATSSRWTGSRARISRRCLRRGPPGLDPALAIGYLEQAADALEHLHKHDPPVVHGDVKPANLILTSSGRVVLVDFGLSSTPNDDLRRAGTAGYVAPEVAAGDRPTPASDVYSFAATAVTLLTGSLSPTARRAGARSSASIPALERIVRPSLATDPARRDPSASVLVARLRRWWGAALPSGTVTLVLVDPSHDARAEAEDSVDEIARAHGGRWSHRPTTGR